MPARLVAGDKSTMCDEPTADGLANDIIRLTCYASEGSLKRERLLGIRNVRGMRPGALEVDARPRHWNPLVSISFMHHSDEAMLRYGIAFPNWEQAKESAARSIAAVGAYAEQTGRVLSWAHHDNPPTANYGLLWGGPILPLELGAGMIWMMENKPARLATDLIGFFEANEDPLSAMSAVQGLAPTAWSADITSAVQGLVPTARPADRTVGEGWTPTVLMHLKYDNRAVIFQDVSTYEEQEQAQYVARHAVELFGAHAEKAGWVRSWEVHNQPPTGRYLVPSKGTTTYDDLADLLASPEPRSSPAGENSKPSGSSAH